MDEFVLKKAMPKRAIIEYYLKNKLNSTIFINNRSNSISFSNIIEKLAIKWLAEYHNQKKFEVF